MKQEEAKENKQYAYKGFNRDLTCRGFQYKIGEIYEMDGTPKLCKRGFHFCDNLKDVFAYYSDSKPHRYCLVEVLGEIDKGDNKSATNKIKIIRELTKREMMSEKDGFNFDVIMMVDANEGLLSGSLALKLQGFDLGRKIKDVDFIMYDKAVMRKVFKGFSETKIMTSGETHNDSLYSFYDKKYGCVYDVFILKTKQPFFVARLHDVNIKVAHHTHIWEAKLRYAFMGSTKHARDFQRFSATLDYNLQVFTKD